MILNSPYITGSATITGNLNVNGTISGTISGTSSYADNANLLDGRDSLTFANTGSNSFVGQQNINGSVAVTGSLTTTGVITAQSINVQQVTSSIVYSSGSNIFGNSVSNTQSITGSVGITGSLSVDGVSTFSGNAAVSSGNQLRLFQSNNANFSYLQSITNGDFVVSTGGTANALIIANNGAATFASTIAATSATFSGALQVGGTGSSTITIGDAVGSAADSNLRLRTGSTKYAWLIASQNNVAGFEITPSTAVGGTTFSTPAFTILPNGNVGIGTTSTPQRLTILDANDAEGLGIYRAFSAASDAGTFIRLGALNGSSVPTAGAAIFGVLESGKTSGYLSLYTYSSSTANERMRIT